MTRDELNDILMAACNSLKELPILWSAVDKYSESLAAAKPVLGAVNGGLIAEWKSKAQRWDALAAKIEKYYIDENGDEIEEGDLFEIGECAAVAFGWI